MLCESHREGKKVKTKTLLNLSVLPEEAILTLKNVLKNKKEALVSVEDIVVDSCNNFGYVFVIEQIMKRLRISEMLDNTLPETTAKLVKAMIIGKLVTKGSKLAIFNWLEREEALAEHFNIDPAKTKLDDFYGSLAVPNLERIQSFLSATVECVSNTTSTTAKN